jgi:hypothetical protein
MIVLVVLLLLSHLEWNLHFVEIILPMKALLRRLHLFVPRVLVLEIMNSNLAIAV